GVLRERAGGLFGNLQISRPRPGNELNTSFDGDVNLTTLKPILVLARSHLLVQVWFPLRRSHRPPRPIRRRVRQSTPQPFPQRVRHLRFVPLALRQRPPEPPRPPLPRQARLR